MNNFVQDKMGSSTPMVDYVTDVDENELPKEIVKYLEEFIWHLNLDTQYKI